SDSLNYANYGRIPHAEPPSHSDRKSCSTRCEISSPGRGYGCLNIADITVDKALDLRNSVSGPKSPPERPMISAIPRFFGSSDSLDYANRWRCPHAEPPSHSDRKSCSTRCEISSPAKELGITFRTGIGIAYVTTIWNRHSETVDKALDLRNSVPGPKSPPERVGDSLDYANRWRSPHAEPHSHSDWKSCSTRREISSSAKQLGITFRTGIGIAYVTTIRNRHSETVDKALVLRNSVLEPKSTPERVGDSLDYANRWRSPHAEPHSHSDWKSSKQFGITFRTGIGIAYVTTIRNRHSETVDKALVSRNSVLGPKSPPERVGDSLDYANRWRSPYAEPPSHSDQKSCLTRCEISSPGRGYGCPNIVDITVVKALVSRNSIPGPKSPLERVSDSIDYANRWRSPQAEPHSHSDRKSYSTRREISSPGRGYGSDSLDYANHWRSPQAEPPIHTDRKSYSTRREISSPGRGYGCPKIADINWHSETVDKVLVSRNSIPGPKSPPEHVGDSLDYANCWRSPYADPPSHSDRKSCLTRCEISSPGRGYGSDSLDYANHWRSPQAQPPIHSDRKSCSTRREISSPGRGYGCPKIADIVTPSIEEEAISLCLSISQLSGSPQEQGETEASRSVDVSVRLAATYVDVSVYLKHKLRFKNSECSCDLERYRARVIENQIKDSSLPHFLEGKPKARKAPAAPTTEGVTINESVSACSQPLRPPKKSSHPPSNPPSNPHKFPSHPSKPYSSVPPPAGYTRPGPKRSHYPPLPETLEDVFFALMSCDAIQLPPQRENTNPRMDTSKYCPYHRAHGHFINNCFTFHDWVYDMNDQGRINWDDVKVAIAKSRMLIPPSSLPLPVSHLPDPSSSSALSPRRPFMSPSGIELFLHLHGHPKMRRIMASTPGRHRI
ncbi:hypothetical protein Taro_016021, partial [Colocasia esculenta]|nr:hypothetical protein [Colocasia esculenta]